MKPGTSFAELYEKIQAMAKLHRDIVADTRKVAIVPNEMFGIDLSFELGDVTLRVTPTPFCARQIAEFAGIPWKYWDKLTSVTPLLADNVRHWLQTDHAPRLLRLYGDDVVRAFLSNRFRTIDNADLCNVILPEIAKPGWTVASSELTETRLYVSAVSSVVQTEIRPGDIVRAGVTISNSEVGAGALTVEPTIFRARDNTAIISKKALRKNHVGRALGGDEDIAEYLSDETRKLDDLALASKIQDVVRAAVEEARFLELAQTLRDAAAIEIDADPPAIVEVTAQRIGLDEGERNRLLRHLTLGADLSVLGVANAVSRLSDDVENYDRAIELQRLSADVLAFTKKSFV